MNQSSPRYIGLALVALADRFVAVFAGGSPAAVPYAVAFAQVYGATAVFLVGYVVLSGALQGASETRIPLVARLTGVFGVLLGGTYLLGVVFGLGPVSAYWAVALHYVWMSAVAFLGFRYTGWADRAAEMMAERGSGTGGG